MLYIPQKCVYCDSVIHWRIPAILSEFAFLHSLLSVLCPLQALGPYCSSKTALLGLTKALATELAPAIRVNCIAPGIIKTKLSSPVSKEGDPIIMN